MATQTPARVTRSQSREATPLPAVQTRQSHAYGAQGKANLRTQVATQGTDFTTAFQNTQETSMAGQQSQGRRTPTGRGPRRRLPSKTGQPTIAEENEPNPNSAVSSRHDAQVASAGARPTTGMLEGDRTGTVIDDQAEYVAVSILDHQPGRLSIFSRTLQRFVPLVASVGAWGIWPILGFIVLFSVTVGLCFLLFLTIMWFYASVCYTTADLIPLPQSIATYGRDFVLGMRVAFQKEPYDRPPDEVERLWALFQQVRNNPEWLPQEEVHGTIQAYINVNHLKRLNELETRIEALEEKASLHNESIAALHTLLPSHLVVRMTNGRWEIPEHFWTALQQRLSTTDDSTAPIWDAYLSHTASRVHQLASQAATEVLDAALESELVISQNQFISVIRSSYESLTRQYKEDMREVLAESRSRAKEVAESSAGELVRRIPANTYVADQLETLVKANQIQRAYEALRTINWFSPALGARIDPRLTSPTYESPAKTWLQWLYKHSSKRSLKPNRPIAALQRWEEATDCWCAAPSEAGKAQIGIKLNEKIYPDKLVIEHMPAAGTLHIAAAPRDVEVWVETRSPAEAQRLEKVMAEEVPMYRSHKCGKKPSPKYVCIGEAQYDIHSHNYVQTFPVFVDAESMGMGVDKFVVRVTSNWGEEATCLYRLRMTGDRVIT